jgi:heme/copper-type cytochrome/quinol oxidase subunit 3
MSGVGNLESASPWKGESRPWGIPRVVLGMWLFIASDSLTFAALFVAYGVSRSASSDWPRPFEPWPSIALAAAMTLCLAASALTMAAAVRRARAGDGRRSAVALGATGALGLIFLILHGSEWWRLVAAGVTPSHNPWGAPLFGGTFYALTGLHMLHVLGGIVALAVVARRSQSGRARVAGITAVGLYWQFVDVVWMLLFVLVYLTSIGSGGGA